MWKVYRIDTDRIIKGGFSSEDEAQDWLDHQHYTNDDNVTVEMMDSDEEDVWNEANRDSEEPLHDPTVVPAPEEDEDDDDDENLEGLQFRGAIPNLEDFDDDLDEEDDLDDEDDEDDSEDDNS